MQFQLSFDATMSSEVTEILPIYQNNMHARLTEAGGDISANLHISATLAVAEKRVMK